MADIYKGNKKRSPAQLKYWDSMKGKMPKNIDFFLEARKNYKLTDEQRKKMSETAIKNGFKPPSRKGTIPWNYQGKTTLRDKIRKSIEYGQWRFNVFKRDNFTCQRCGDESKTSIEAHHIKSFSNIVKENHITTLQEALECTELWDINNGQTLCLKCHKLTDNYGHKKR